MVYSDYQKDLGFGLVKEVPTSKTEIKTSQISGNGTFATQKIQQGEFITKLKGQPFAEKDFYTVCKEKGIAEDDPLQVADDVYLILEYASKAINHSCNPNTALRNTSDLHALKEISPGEELTYDYSTSVGVDDDWQMHCKCGAKNCRKIVGNILTIPDKVLQKYKKANGLQDFILQQLLKIEMKKK